MFYRDFNPLVCKKCIHQFNTRNNKNKIQLPSISDVIKEIEVPINKSKDYISLFNQWIDSSLNPKTFCLLKVEANNAYDLNYQTNLLLVQNIELMKQTANVLGDYAPFPFTFLFSSLKNNEMFDPNQSSNDIQKSADYLIQYY